MANRQLLVTASVEMEIPRNDNSPLLTAAYSPPTPRRGMAFADGHAKWFPVGKDSGSYADGRTPADGKPLVTP